MSTHQQPPIGSSVVHLITSHAGQFEREALSSTIAQPKPLSPCLLLPYHIRETNRLLLNGPQKSGKTSFAMDLAYSYASNFACQCVDENQCECAAVLFFRTASSIESDAENFPPPCHKVISQSDNQHISLRHSNFQDKAKYKNESFNSKVLRRIKILYVSAVQDIHSELLLLLGMSIPLKPPHAIILDDIDKIASSDTSPTSSMMQTCRSILPFLSLQIFFSFF
jgi:hypothetical protein